MLASRKRQWLLGLVPLLFFMVGLLSVRMLGTSLHPEAILATILSILGAVASMALVIHDSQPPRTHNHGSGPA